VRSPTGGTRCATRGTPAKAAIGLRANFSKIRNQHRTDQRVRDESRQRKVARIQLNYRLRGVDGQRRPTRPYRILESSIGRSPVFRQRDKFAGALRPVFAARCGDFSFGPQTAPHPRGARSILGRRDVPNLLRCNSRHPQQVQPAGRGLKPPILRVGEMLRFQEASDWPFSGDGAPCGDRASVAPEVSSQLFSRSLLCVPSGSLRRATSLLPSERIQSRLVFGVARAEHHGCYRPAMNPGSTHLVVRCRPGVNGGDKLEFRFSSHNSVLQRRHKTKF